MANRASEGYRRALAFQDAFINTLAGVFDLFVKRHDSGNKKRSTDNNSGTMERDILLSQTTRNRERGERVNALLAEAKAHEITTTRRQARKALSGRGSLGRKLAEACDGCRGESRGPLVTVTDDTAEKRETPRVRVFRGTAKQAQELLESLAYCQAVVSVGKVCGRETPCEEHRVPEWDERWSCEIEGERA